MTELVKQVVGECRNKQDAHKSSDYLAVYVAGRSHELHLAPIGLTNLDSLTSNVKGCQPSIVTLSAS
jgi:hypothetical protein